MELLDALASNVSTRSVVELSLSPLFRRDYSALFKAIRLERLKSPQELIDSNMEVER